MISALSLDLFHMKRKPLISVVMPVYNAEQYLEKAIDSILSQTLIEFELIIINDASTDKTLQIIQSFREKDKRIKIINNKRNLHMATSLNIGINQARSDIIARMDQDDISLPRRFEIQYSFLKTHPEIAIVGNNILIINERGQIIGRRTYPTTSSLLKKIMFRYSPFAHPTVMFRKEAYQKVGGYNPDLYPCEDIDFWFRLGIKYTFASIPETLFKYRISLVSGSHQNIRDTELMGFKIRLDAIKKYRYKPGFSDTIYNLLQFLSLWFIPTRSRIRLYNILRGNNII